MTDFQFYKDWHRTSTTISELPIIGLKNTFCFCKILCDFLLSTAVNLVQLSFAEIVMLSWKEAVYIYESHRISCIRTHVWLVGQLAGMMHAEGDVTVVSFRSQHQPSSKKHVTQTLSNIMAITLCFTGNAFCCWKYISPLFDYSPKTFTELKEKKIFCNKQNNVNESRSRPLIRSLAIKTQVTIDFSRFALFMKNSIVNVEWCLDIRFVFTSNYVRNWHAWILFKTEIFEAADFRF